MVKSIKITNVAAQIEHSHVLDIVASWEKF